VQAAISRQRKEETVAQLEELLKDSAVVVGLRYQGLTVKQLQDFRRSLPEQSKMLVCKNTLMRVACDKVDGWSELKPATKGDNAWLFVNEEVRQRGGQCCALQWQQCGMVKNELALYTRPACRHSGSLPSPRLACLRLLGLCCCR
jgi:hypothetical protein